jgi:peptidoglycan-associated lipoprotein
MHALRPTLLFAGLFALAFASSCGPKYPKCDKDEHCAEKGEVCVEGMCQQCRDDTNCEEGMTCKGGRCEPKSECSSDSDCTDNKVCRSGKCQIECQSDGDCGVGLKCQNNRCIDKLACASDADCAEGMSCISGRCGVQNASRAMCDYPAVRFPFNEATLSEGVKSELQGVAECLKSKGGRVTIEGHCDERGTEEYNLALGDRRAREVRKYLVRLGVPENKLEILSKGENEPKSSASTEEGWSENRRAEFIER